MTYAEITRKKRAKPPAIDGLQDENKSTPYLATANSSGDLNGFVKQKPSRRKKNRNSSNTAGGAKPQ